MQDDFPHIGCDDDFPREDRGPSKTLVMAAWTAVFVVWVMCVALMMIFFAHHVTFNEPRVSHDAPYTHSRDAE